ncbi:hypothetical protein [Sorangium sp. So ce854]|uniref:hypothetical protein n=1 Tax=Sorangium sp. So ce854 TaxID=3133322 RepID=UPI003F5EEBA6
MSIGTRERACCGGAFVVGAAMFLGACERPPSAVAGGAPPASSAAKGAAPRAAARPAMAVLAQDERRVPLLVVPGDVLVEVDGQPAYRRDGAIDLTGKVGDVRLVRVWKGAKKPLEKRVMIREIQPSPPLVDLNEVLPAKPAAKAPKRPECIYDFDDD